MFLGELFPDQDQLFDTLILTRFGNLLEDDGTPEAAIGIDAPKVFYDAPPRGWGKLESKKH